MSTETLTQDILDARRNLPRFIPDDLLIITNTNAAHDLAEHLTTRGWRQQTTITTLDELEALPAGTVVRDNGNDVSERRNHAKGEDWYCIGIYDTLPTSHIELPARVLYRPEGE